MEIANEYIKHAAVKTTDGIALIGKSYACCFNRGEDYSKLSSKADDQGFITNHGRFVNRVEAAKIAREVGQVSDDVYFLHSEDLWSEEHGGKHDYDETMGYVLKGEYRWV